MVSTLGYFVYFIIVLFGTFYVLAYIGIGIEWLADRFKK